MRIRTYGVVRGVMLKCPPTRLSALGAVRADGQPVRRHCRPCFGTAERGPASAGVDEKTGIPVYYELFFGALLDKSQTPFTLKNAERLGFRKLFVVMDRGYYRKEVFEAFEGMSFACMCPENMPEFDKVWSKHHSEIKDQHKYFVPAEKVYGIKGDDVKVYDRTYKAFLYYDSARAEDERDTIHLKLGMLKEQAAARKNYSAKMSRTFAPWLIIEKLDEPDPKTGKKFRITENNERIQDELDKAGFFLVVSDCDCSTEEMIIRARGFGLTRRTMSYALGMLNKYEIELQNDRTWAPVYALTWDMREIFRELGMERPDDDVPAMVRRLKIRL